MNNDSLLKKKRKSLRPPPVIQEIRKEYIEKQFEVVHSKVHRDYTRDKLGHEPSEEELWEHFALEGGATNFCIHEWREFWEKRGLEEEDKSSWMEYWRLRKEERILKKKRKEEMRKAK